MALTEHFDLDAMTTLVQKVGTLAAAVSCTASALANLLPPEEKLELWPRTRRVYQWFIKCVAGAALNIRRRLPSLDIPMPGFTHHCTECQKREDVAVDEQTTSASAVDKGEDTRG